MYFLTSLFCAAISWTFFWFSKDKKDLHLDVLAIIFSSSTIMWLVDCFFSLADGQPFISFSDPKDGWIALWTVFGGIFLWLIITVVINFGKKKV
jgi:hypothetical protein